MPALRRFAPLLILLLSVQSTFGGGSIGADGTQPTRYAANRLPLIYRTDKGNLGTFSNTLATQIAVFSFSEWSNLATASLSFLNQGELDRDVTSANDAYISGIEQYSDGVFPVVFDTDGAITDARIGAGARQQIYGFASSFSFDGVTYEEGFVIINGFLTSRPNIEPVYREVITHEIGHMLGVAHSQIGMSAEYPLMYPTTQAQSVSGIEADDAAAISALYPAPGYFSTVGSISGTITGYDGTPLSGVNVIAVNAATGAVYSTVSDYFGGDDLRFFNKPPRTGGYVLSGLPPGNYFVRIEPINPIFQNGSQVASYLTPINTDFWHDWYNGEEDEDGNMLLDNSNERTSVAVTAGNTTSGIDIAVNDSPTLRTLTEHTSTVSQEITLPLEPNPGVTLSRFAVRYTAPENGSLLGVRLWTQASSYMPADASMTITVHRDTPGSLAGIPGTELGSVTVPMSELAGDQHNDIWLRGIGNAVNFFQGEKFHVSVRLNGDAVLTCFLDDGTGTKNQTSYYVQQAGRWFNFPEGLSGAGVAGWNLFMSAIYTSVPAGVEAPLVDVPSELKFGSTRVGVKTTAEAVLRNVGTADLNVTNVLITGANSDKFSIESGGGAFTLKPGERRTVIVGFTPVDAPQVTALLQFMHNANGSPTIVTLSGSGKQAVLVPVATMIDFGEQRINTFAQQEPIVFRNGGADTLRVMSVELEGEGFTLGSPSGAAQVAPVGSFKVRVSFRPTEEKLYTGVVRIRHELGNDPLEITLRGEGTNATGNVASELVADGLRLSMGSIQPNPVHDGALIAWQLNGTGRLPVEILITDISGRTIHVEKRELIGIGGTYRESMQLDVRDLPSGEYHAVIRSARGSVAQRFVVLR